MRRFLKWAMLALFLPAIPAGAATVLFYSNQIQFGQGAGLPTGFLGIDNLQFDTATPEPSTWLQLAAGLGVFLRRRS